MAGRKVIYIQIVSLLFLYACRGREVTIPLAYEGDKLVIWGRLQAGKPIKIKIGRTFPAVGAIPGQIAVTMANVSLYKNGSFYVHLSHSSHEEGVYVSDSLIRAGEIYMIKAEATGFPTAISAPVKIPESIPKLTYILTKDVPGTKLPLVPQDLISLYFEPNDQIVNSYVAVGFLASFQEVALPTNWPTADNIIANEEDCHAWATDPEKKFGNLFLINGSCVVKNRPLNFSVASGNFSKLPNSKGEYERAYQLTMLVASITEGWFVYNQIEGNQPGGLDHLVVPLQMAYSNIENGYGMVYGMNLQQIELK
ncbi:DUF4249 domain-containing protein [Leadbetterella sp. DM7]|uniref:DUF4249 domain-containing protein n=1 Tax=Leadbetterella sp. DM7 TaxID=3235085 RepID=UPI00349EE4EF